MDQNKEDKPITVKDINNFRKNYLKGSFPVLLVGGVLCIVMSLSFILGAEEDQGYLVFLSVLTLIFGVIFLISAFWAKNKSKNL